MWANVWISTVGLESTLVIYRRYLNLSSIIKLEGVTDLLTDLNVRILPDVEPPPPQPPINLTLELQLFISNKYNSCHSSSYSRCDSFLNFSRSIFWTLISDPFVRF